MDGIWITVVENALYHPRIEQKTLDSMSIIVAALIGYLAVNVKGIINNTNCGLGLHDFCLVS